MEITQQDLTPVVGRSFTTPDLLQIAFPLGGLGAGNVCLNGHGGLQDYALRGLPATTAVPDGHYNTVAAFALLHIKGDAPVTRLVEGPFPIEKAYDQGLQGQGYRKGGHEGLPRFHDCTFTGAYPFGEVALSDPKVPLDVTLTGWSPFIPLDDKNSGIPCAILDYTLTNTSDKSVEYGFSYHLSHLVEGEKGELGLRSAAIPGKGVLFTNNQEPHEQTFGSAALTVIGHTPRIKAVWLRGAFWPFDAISALWREVTTDAFRENAGDQSEQKGRSGGSVLLEGTLQPGESITYPIVVSWYFPNRYQTVEQDLGAKDCGPGCDCGPETPAAGPAWRPYYAGVWNDAADVAAYVDTHYESLLARTRAFQQALFSSTLPPEVLDAVSANLAILKSPTVLRQENGNVWGWEGCFTDSGCCHGTCTHVWNYAQSLPHLFPALERTLREQEYVRSMDDRGHVSFRAALPDAPTFHGFHAAADGQLGGLMKLYRDWHISGDTEWLASLYPLAKRSLDFCIEHWDPEHKGGLFEPHHNTYDIEFWGPDGMCTSIYIGALCAMAEMSRALGSTGAAESYAALAASGAELMDSQLFNGEYYEQHVQWDGLRDKSFLENLKEIANAEDDLSVILKAEGPRYQYGSGCLSDGIIGAWFAALYGVETPLDTAHVRSHLQSIFQHNYKSDLSEHICLQRPGYAMGTEPGLLLCSWPRGNKPTLPFVYSDEVWTGIEYQVATHLIAEGGVDEGLTIVKAARSRYDGHARNPWNEYECGSYYARAMASYALLNTLSGFRYSATDKTLWLSPKIEADPFKIFFSAATGFGTITLTKDTITVELCEGTLAVDRVKIEWGGVVKEIEWGVVAEAGSSATLV